MHCRKSQFSKKKLLFWSRSSKTAQIKAALAGKVANLFCNSILFCVTEGAYKNV
jgi:hypothetical protein